MIKLNLIFFICFVWFNSARSQDIQIISDFESASIGSLKQVAPRKFKGQTMHWIKYDQDGNQYYWFYYKIINVKNKTVRFEFDNLIGIYRGGQHICYTDYTQPVISYDNESWTRIEEVAYDEAERSFRFSMHFEQDTAWIAYAHPYPYSRYMRYLESVKSSPFLNIIAEGTSPEGRSIPLLEITNSKSRKDKKRVFIMALQHPGEDAGGYSVEGIINFLLSDNIQAQKIRDEYIYYIIPMMNPDGVFHGVSRYTPKMQDLNNEWGGEDPNRIKTTPQEVKFVKNWITNKYKENITIDLFVDIHCHLQKNRNIAFLDRSKKTEVLRELKENMNEYWPHVRYSHSYFSGRRASNYAAKLGIPALVVEFTQSYEKEGKGNYLNIEDYRLFGEDMIKAIRNFFN